MSQKTMLRIYINNLKLVSSLTIIGRSAMIYFYFRQQHSMTTSTSCVAAEAAKALFQLLNHQLLPS